MLFPSLPGSEKEASVIVNIWGDAVESGNGSTLLTGVSADEASFKASAPGKRVLHLATHGFFVNGQCDSALAPGGARNASKYGGFGENPLLLSGLVFAGANHRGIAGPNEDDGILMAEEIAALDLRGVEWAVLSACDTGVGGVQVGEGVLGLRRAFQVAGVRTLIMSLWPVDDDVTQQWMQTLYTNRFSDGLSTAEAVQNTYRQMLHERRSANQSTHPFYWAAFVAAGDWR